MSVGFIQGEFLFDYDKVRISEHHTTRKNLSLPEISIEMIQNHDADFYSLLYVLKGQGYAYLNGEKYPLLPNTLIIADRFSVIVTVCSEQDSELVTYAVDFKPELFGRMRSPEPDFAETLKFVIGTFPEYKFKLPDKYIFNDKDKKVLQLFNNAYNEYKERKLKYADIIRDNIRAVLIEIARDINCFTDNNVSSDLVKRIVDYSEIHFKEKITVKDLAKRFNYSESYITKMCKRELNMPFAEYLRQKRIYNASCLLSATNKKVKEIANEVGYTDVAYFTECFEKYIGISPSLYRKRVLESKNWFVGLEYIKSQKKIYI